MQVYHFDMATGQYIGQSKAIESPREPGKFLVPAHATLIAPPECAQGECAYWTNNAWTVGPLPVEESTEEHPADQTPPTEAELAAQVRAERDARIKAIRWRIERHKDERDLSRTPTEPLPPLLEYVQALRDVPQQDGFPRDVVWPETKKF